ncbi:MAG: hypothetical protein NC416_13040 [Eubacterium sp.]|nr:hypothetical protein [Eubacterium sp.]
MHIEKIEWLSKEGKEAILTVVSDTKRLVCFSCPCFNNIGDELTEPIECLDTYDVVLCEKREDSIEKMEGEFEYKLQGELKDVQNGTVDVYGFIIHIDENRIPGDITNGMFIQFIVSRLDIW